MAGAEPQVIDPFTMRPRKTCLFRRAISGLIQAHLFHRDLGPINVEFLRDQHRQGGLDALAGFRVLGCNLDERLAS